MKTLIQTVLSDAPDPTFGNRLLAQFRRANDELTAAVADSFKV